MKKIILCLTILLMTDFMAFGQRGLNCHPVFRGKVVPLELMVSTEVRGGEMATYKLDYYRGVTFRADTATARKVGALVAADADAARSCQTEKTGDILTYALIELKPDKKINRYLCYQARPSGYIWKITLLYLEGVATLEDLHSMFEKQETKEK
ncbi:MAG: hypothetical protein J6X69_08035 [Bacteroidales bacterium]|nr:hypothetical protein [Bacteroidales bacterium]